MAQSLSKLYVHIIFHIKKSSPKIKDDVKANLYAYMGTVIKDNDSIPLLINGTDDHVHIFCVMSKNIALAKLVEEIKRHSSRWIKKQSGNFDKFTWQGGYAGFSVSQAVQSKTRDYIKNQEEHHRRISFKDELILFLKEYGLDYDERYLWND